MSRQRRPRNSGSGIASLFNTIGGAFRTTWDVCTSKRNLAAFAIVASCISIADSAYDRQSDGVAALKNFTGSDALAMGYNIPGELAVEAYDVGAWAVNGAIKVGKNVYSFGEATVDYLAPRY